jgi:hypothetical protein
MSQGARLVTKGGWRALTKSHLFGLPVISGRPFSFLEHNAVSLNAAKYSTVLIVRPSLSILSAIVLVGTIVFSGNSMSRVDLRYLSPTVTDSPMSEKPRTRKLPTGVWGGPHIRMEVTAREVSIEYDCAHATIDQPIVLDRYGRFSISGRQFSEHGGPVRDESNDGYPARFSGVVKGNSMNLKVENSATKELIGNFTVVYGAQPRLFKCK